MRRWVVGRSPDRIFYSQALDGSYLATPDGQMAGSPLSLWITGALQIPHRLQKVGNRWWRSLSANLLQRGFVSPSVLKRSLPTAVTQAAVAIARRQIRRPHRRCDAFSRAAIRDRGLNGAGMASTQIHARQERPQPVTKVRVNVARLPSALPSRDRPRVDVRFTSEAARSGSLVPPATSPLTASMPSTVGCRDLPALSAGSGRRCACICDVERTDW
jgi:hypothetical protein